MKYNNRGEIGGHTVKLSPQPQVPFTLGLLKINSLASFDSTKSISVPSIVSCALASMNNLAPAIFIYSECVTKMTSRRFLSMGYSRSSGVATGQTDHCLDNKPGKN